MFGIVDNLLGKHPQIAYIKWDANVELKNYGSTYLPQDKQSHIYIEYHRGLNKVLERIRAKYPDVLIQACGGGGGRASYGVLPYMQWVPRTSIRPTPWHSISVPRPTTRRDVSSLSSSVATWP